LLRFIFTLEPHNLITITSGIVVRGLPISVLARSEDKWVYYKYDGWKNLCALLNCLLNDRTKPQMAKNKSLFTLHNL